MLQKTRRNMQPSPKNRCRKWIGIIQGLLAICALFSFTGCISWTTTNVEHFSHGIEVHAQSHHKWRCTCIHSGGITLLPIPVYDVINNYQRIVLADGKEWARCGRFGNLFVSPDQTYIVLTRSGQTESIQILDLPTRQIRELTADANSKDEFPKNLHYGYPFSFVRWEDDSSFLVEVFGWFVENVKDGNGNDVKYKCDNCGEMHTQSRQVNETQTWRVDAKTATHIRIDQKFQPLSH